MSDTKKPRKRGRKSAGLPDAQAHAALVAEQPNATQDASKAEALAEDISLSTLGLSANNEILSEFATAEALNAALDAAITEAELVNGIQSESLAPQSQGETEISEPSFEGTPYASEQQVKAQEGAYLAEEIPAIDEGGVSTELPVAIEPISAKVLQPEANTGTDVKTAEESVETSAEDIAPNTTKKTRKTRTKKDAPMSENQQHATGTEKMEKLAFVSEDAKAERAARAKRPLIPKIANEEEAEKAHVESERLVLEVRQTAQRAMLPEVDTSKNAALHTNGSSRFGAFAMTAVAALVIGFGANFIGSKLTSQKEVALSAEEKAAIETVKLFKEQGLSIEDIRELAKQNNVENISEIAKKAEISALVETAVANVADPFKSSNGESKQNIAVKADTQAAKQQESADLKKASDATTKLIAEQNEQLRIEKEQLRIEKEKAAVLESSIAAISAKTNQPIQITQKQMCESFGPVSKDYANEALKVENFNAVISTTPVNTESKGYVVYLPKALASSEGIVDELKTKGLTDMYRISGTGRFNGVIALGAFRGEISANRQKDTLAEKGIKGVEVAPINEPNQFNLRITGMADDIERIKRKHPEIFGNARSC
jgi:hypothetical protein